MNSRQMFAVAAVIGLLAAMSVFPVRDAAAENTLLAQASGTTTLHSVPASKGRLVGPATGLKAAGNNSAVTCCKNWNSSTGGTNCAEYNMCPAGSFEVECGKGGCW